MRDTVILLVVCSMLLGIFTVILPVETCKASETLHVGSGYEYATIQSAIDAANNSDTIRIHSGTYEEFIEINKEITIIGDGTSNTIINSKNINNPVLNTIQINSPNVSISSCTIKNTYHASIGHSCIVISSGSYGCTISNNIIKQGGNGIYLVISTNNIINANIIEDNEHNGISITTNANENQIYDNIIQNNEYNGIRIISSSQNTFYDNTITGHVNYGITLSSNSNNNLFYHNTFSENNDGNANDPFTNQWYSTQLNEGNSWDDYDGYDNNDDGIGDTPYNIPGGSSKDQKPIGIFRELKAYISSISPNPATHDETITFDGYGIPQDEIIGWEWKINNNIVSSSEDFTYPGLSTGTYSIYFRVQNIHGEWSTYTQQTLVIKSQQSTPQENHQPIAYITTINPSPVTYGQQVSFQGYGEDSDGTISAYYWTSNIDGEIGQSNSFYKSDLSIGTHTIYLKVRDNEGKLSETVTRTLTVLPDTSNPNNIAPTADADGPYSGFANVSVSFNGLKSSDSDGTITIYRWTFGDGTTGANSTTSHIYSNPGTYPISLTVTDNNGKTDTDTTTVTIQPQEENNNTSDDKKSDKWVIPGFEAILVFLVITIITIIKKIKKKK
jgi:parallel beta-helix repeat protein